MRYLKRIMIFFILNLSFHVVYGQTSDAPDPSKIKKYIPTSPEASSLGKYGDIPVGLYTGVPNINIPLYVIKIKEFELPISLSYNSSGIKVEEMATNTGLGWTLNSGGFLSVSVNGLADIGDRGMLNPQSGDDVIPPYVLTNESLEYDHFKPEGGVEYKFAKNAADGLIDTQPDLFQYSIPGSSGKFYFDVHRQAHPVPFSAIKIAHLGLMDFKIIDENGRVFYFKALESSIMENLCGPIVTNNTVFLSDIELPDGNKITFHYTKLNYTYRVQPSLSRQRLVPGNTNYHFRDCVDPNDVITISSSRLSGITSTAGHNIQMTYSNNRLDLPGTQSLDKIVINNDSGSIQSYDFNYDYFITPLSSSPDGKRLKLTSITGMDGKQHSFEYNETITVPERLSFGQDHWGYYNGKSINTTLLPKEEEYGFYDGANREVDSSFSQMAILKQINYPTGGFTRFNYEQNDYYFSGEEVAYLPVSFSAYGRDYESVSTSFTIPDGHYALDATVRFNDGSGPVSGPPGQEPVDRDTKISISGNGFYQSYYNELSPNGRIGVELPAGTYTISVTCDSEAKGAFCSIEYKTKVVTQIEKNKLIGGLRIKNIVNKSSPEGINEIKYYQYREQDHPERSSGRMNFYPLYTFSNPRFFFITAMPIYTNYWKQTAQSVYPIGSIKGGSVGYTFVSNYYGLNGENGKTESTFNFTANSGGSLSTPRVPFIDNDWKNGSLEKEIHYRNMDGVFQPISELRNFYSIQPESVFWNSHYVPSTYDPNYLLRGRGVAIEYKVTEALGDLFKAQFRVNDFRYISEWLRLDSSYSINHEYSPLSSMKKVNQSIYNNMSHLMPSIVETSISNGAFLQNKIWYPQDFPIGTSVAIDSLITRNRINIPLKQELKNDLSVSTTNYVYKNWSSKITEPEYVQTQTGVEALENRIQYYDYDNRANVLSVGQFRGAKVNYIWSYNKTLPIAEIANVDYQTILIALGGQPAIDAFANRPNPSKEDIEFFLAPLAVGTTFNNAQLSSYSYDPLVGMLTSKDPKGMVVFYEYDSSKRLKSIKDQNGNIVKSYDYHYKP